MPAQLIRWALLPALTAIAFVGGLSSPLAAPAAGAPPAATAPHPGAGAAPVTGPEPPITATGSEGQYLRAMHDGIHFRWAKRFIERTAAARPATDPLNNPELEAEVLFVIRWDGSPAQITVSQSSGLEAFDDAAVDAVKGDRPYPVPPIDLYGDDGVAHVKWVFRRDARLCSGGEIRRFEAPLAEALPRLFVQGRMKEAVLRAVRESRSGRGDAISEFARAFLARPFTDPIVGARAAAALAPDGNPRAIERLRRALGFPDTMPIAAPALAAAKVDVCALVRPALEGPSPDDAFLASRTLRTAGVELAADSPCVAFLTTTIKAGVASAALRADLLDTLAVVSPGGVRKLATEALGDKDPKMRAAGARALARPRGGRPTLYRLQPLIGDPSIEVRSAVAAGLVRACGDLATDFLRPILNGRDVQPLVAMTEELGHASSPASADLLAKLQKRQEPELRLPLLAALAARQDPAGRALYRPLADSIKKDEFAPVEARRIVYASAEPEDLARLTKDPHFGIYAYKAMLRAGRHGDAMDWLVASYDRLTPETLVEALAAWLAMPPGRLSAK